MTGATRVSVGLGRGVDENVADRPVMESLLRLKLARVRAPLLSSSPTLMMFLLNAFLSSARNSGVSSFPLCDPPAPVDANAELPELAPFRVDVPEGAEGGTDIEGGGGKREEEEELTPTGGQVTRGCGKTNLCCPDAGKDAWRERRHQQQSASEVPAEDTDMQATIHKEDDNSRSKSLLSFTYVACSVVSRVVCVLVCVRSRSAGGRSVAGAETKLANWIPTGLRRSSTRLSTTQPSEEFGDRTAALGTATPARGTTQHSVRGRRRRRKGGVDTCSCCRSKSPGVRVASSPSPPLAQRPNGPPAAAAMQQQQQRLDVSSPHRPYPSSFQAGLSPTPFSPGYSQPSVGGQQQQHQQPQRGDQSASSAPELSPDELSWLQYVRRHELLPYIDSHKGASAASGPVPSASSSSSNIGSLLNRPTTPALPTSPTGAVSGQQGQTKNIGFALVLNKVTGIRIPPHVEAKVRPACSHRGDTERERREAHRSLLTFTPCLCSSLMFPGVS